MRPDLNILPGDSGCSVWFYNGMSQPRLLAGSIAGLLTDVTITSNYLKFMKWCRSGLRPAGVTWRI